MIDRLPKVYGKDGRRPRADARRATSPASTSTSRRRRAARCRCRPGSPTSASRSPAPWKADRRRRRRLDRARAVRRRRRRRAQERGDARRARPRTSAPTHGAPHLRGLPQPRQRRRPGAHRRSRSRTTCATRRSSTRRASAIGFAAGQRRRAARPQLLPQLSGLAEQARIKYERLKLSTPLGAIDLATRGRCPTTSSSARAARRPAIRS